jgi:hypothetical protein
MIVQLRRAFIALVVCLASLTAAASGLAATTPAASGTVYGGYTSQDAPLVVTLDRTRTQIRTVGIWVVSADHYVFSRTGRAVAVKPPVLRMGDDFITNARISRTGAFKATGTAVMSYAGDNGTVLPGVVTYTLTGKVRRAVMQGTLKAQLALTDPSTMKVAKTVTFGTRRWVASSQPGRVFAGTTKAQEPVVIELNATGHVCKVLRVPWHADGPAGSWVIAEAFTNMTLRGGAYSRVWSQPYSRDDGGQNTFDYNLSVRVGATKASGALQVKVTETSAAGAVEGAYDSGRVTFTATTSAKTAK